MNKILGCLVLSAMTTAVFAQSGTNSPYSQFGFGDLADQGVGFNKGMNGVGLGFRKGNEVNPLNPASYSSVDSLTMIFDAGLSGQITNFKENGTRLNGKSAGFDYIVGTLRAAKNFGLSFGVLPYSNVGYKYSNNQKTEAFSTTVTNEGNGGLHQLYLGAGWRIFKPLSLGVNISYLWGDTERKITDATTVTNASVKSLIKEYSMSVNNYKLDFGIQYEQQLTKNDFLTLGATFSPGHKLNADPVCRIISTDASTTKSDTTLFELNNVLSLPTTYGVGLTYSHASNFRIGADFHLQKWGSVEYPVHQGEQYVLREGMLKDSYKLNIGAEWIPNPISRRSLLDHVRYRIGAGYTTPYYYINGQEGPKELGASLGFGIPIGRSFLNISGQWAHRSAKNLITENTFRISVGLTFNERWFAKWKVE